MARMRQAMDFDRSGRLYFVHNHPGFRQSTWYWPPRGKLESDGSIHRKNFNALGKMKRKSVRSASNPQSWTIRRISKCESMTASRSKGTRLITYLVPGFQGLFSQIAKIPPGRR